MRKARNPGMPPAWWRVAKHLRVAHVGRRDGRLGVPYDHFIPDGRDLDAKQWTRYIRAIAADSAYRRARVMKSFIRNSKKEQGALLLAAGRVNDLARRLMRIEPPDQPPSPARTFPLSAEEVITARNARSTGEERRFVNTEFAAARQVMTDKLAVYEIAISRMRTEMHEVAEWSNRLVAYYHQALDRAYLAKKKKEGDREVKLPHWDPAQIKPDTSEEALVLSGDLLTVLSPKVRGVVEEALRHLGNPAGEQGVA